MSFIRENWNLPLLTRPLMDSSRWFYGQNKGNCGNFLSIMSKVESLAIRFSCSFSPNTIPFVNIDRIGRGDQRWFPRAHLSATSFGTVVSAKRSRPPFHGPCHRRSQQESILDRSQEKRTHRLVQGIFRLQAKHSHWNRSHPRSGNKTCSVFISLKLISFLSLWFLQ